LLVDDIIDQHWVFIAAKRLAERVPILPKPPISTVLP
jgi:hypothetical protein